MKLEIMMSMMFQSVLQGRHSKMMMSIATQEESRRVEIMMRMAVSIDQRIMPGETGIQQEEKENGGSVEKAQAHHRKMNGTTQTSG